MPPWWNPGDRQTNYTVTLLNGTLTIAQVCPSSELGPSRLITYGTAAPFQPIGRDGECAGQLCLWTQPAAGLNAGTNILSVAFTPA